MSAFVSALHKMAGKNLFVCVTPDAADFTAPKPISLVLSAGEGRITVSVPPSRADVASTLSSLSLFLTPDRFVIGWNLKSLFSYALGMTSVPLTLESPALDLKILEWYIGIEKEPPKNLPEATARLQAVLKHPSWVLLKKLYSDVYNPLLRRVVPDMETVGIIDPKLRKKLHAHYEIAGQSNGRMKCLLDFAHGFNPHTIGAEQRALLRPPMFDHDFVYLDFQAMEASTLQWLSGDPVLGRILDGEGDLYDGIWTELTGLASSEEYRKKSKAIFLPVAYGLGAESMAKKLGIDISTAAKLVDRVYKVFHVAMNWMKRQQDGIVEGWARDVFGRLKYFPTDLYKVRNFVVQSPAALVCLEKLVKLHHDVRKIATLAFHVHDGYVIYCPRTELKRLKEVATESLQAESELAKGLKLKVSCLSAASLEKLS